MFGVAAIAKVNPDHIKGGTESFIGRDQHVTRGARSFHAVPKHERWMFRAIRLPAAASQNLTARLDFEQTFFVACAIAGAPAAGPEMSADSLRVALFENAMGNKGFGGEVGSNLLEQVGDAIIFRDYMLSVIHHRDSERT
jgi:hypothetical protein